MVFVYAIKKVYRLRKDLETLDETAVAGIIIKRKKIFFVLSCRHPTQSRDEMNVYMAALQNIYEKMKNEKPTTTITTGDYNSRPSPFWETILKIGKAVFFIIEQFGGTY